MSTVRERLSAPVVRRLAAFAFPFSAAVCVFYYQAAAGFAAGAAALIVFAMSWIGRADRGYRIRIACAGIVLGVLVIFTRGIAENRDRAALERLDGYTGNITIRIIKQTGLSQYDDVTASYSVDAAAESGARFKASVNIKNRGLKPGDLITALGLVSYNPETGGVTVKLAGDQIPFGRDIVPKHIPIIAASAVSKNINKVFPDDISAFLRSITIGDRSDFFNSDDYEAVRKAGASHIVAVSGMHISFLIAMVSAVFRRRKLMAIIGIPVIFMFAFMGGFTPSVVRAVLMQSLVLIAPLFRRRHDNITSVAFALGLILAFDPYSVGQMGLQLSFLATLGIVTVTPRISERLNTKAAVKYDITDSTGCIRKAFRKGVRKLRTFAAESIAASVGALIFTTPLIAYYFGSVSIAAPLTNILIIWAASLAFCGTLIAAGLAFLWVPAGSALALAAALPARYILIVCRFIANIPYSSIYLTNRFVLMWLVIVYAAVILFVFSGIRKRETITLITGSVVTLIIALVLPRPLSGLSVTAVNVGQGQCIVVTYNEHAAIIDCGSQADDAGAALDAFMQSVGLDTVEIIFLTHYDYDHTSGTGHVFDKYHPDILAVPAPEEDDELSAEAVISDAVAYGVDIEYIDSPAVYTLGEAEIMAYPIEGGRNNGVIYLVKEGDWEALIPGDTDELGELIYIEAYSPPDIELLIVGHHGSKYSTSEDLLRAVAPEEAIISSGYNTYGHPTPETLGRLADFGVIVYRTDKAGTVTINANI